MQADIALVALADVSRDARTLNLARALAAAGLTVHVIAAAPAAWNDPALTLHRWPDPGGSAVARWRSLCAFASSLSVTARVVGAMDLFAVSAAKVIARRTSAPFLYDMREFYFALGPLEGKGWKQRLISWYEAHRVVPHATAVIVTSEMDADVVMDHYHLPERPHVLMNTPPYHARMVSTLLRERFSIPSDHCVVIYQGVVHDGRGLAPFMQAMPEMEDVHLCIIGEGPAQQHLSEHAQRLGIGSRVHWLGSVPYDALHAVTCSADIGLCLIEPVSKSYEYALPNKLFEYMMARIPSLVSDLPALRRQMYETPVGMLVDRSLSKRSIIEAMERLRVPGTRDALIQQCEAIRDLSYERQAVKAVDLFREHLR